MSAPVLHDLPDCPMSQPGAVPTACVLAEVMAHAALGILVVDTAQGRVLFENPEATALLTAAGLAPGYAARAGVFLAARPGPTAPGTPPETCRLGQHLLGYSVYGEGPLRWVVFRDITEKVRLEAIAEAVETMNNIGYVFAAVRHELGNPINAVKAALSVLQQQWTRFPPAAIAEYLERSLAALARAERLLTSLKSFSFYEDIRPEPVALNEYLDGFVALAGKDCRERGIALRLVPDPAVGKVLADPRALTQVLLNLLANATDACAGRPDPAITLWTLPGVGGAALAVMDNGCGMSAQVQATLFRPFHTSKPGGTGLGLIIAKKMLAKMSGTLELTSRAGEGTAVTVTLRGAA